jgi:hypothetical protein
MVHMRHTSRGQENHQITHRLWRNHNFYSCEALSFGRVCFQVLGMVQLRKLPCHNLGEGRPVLPQGLERVSLSYKEQY